MWGQDRKLPPAKHSPWLNAVEPKGVHGKRKVVEPDGLLGAYELADRVYRASVVRIMSIYSFSGGRLLLHKTNGSIVATIQVITLMISGHANLAMEAR